MSTIQDTLDALITQAYSACASDLHLVAKQVPRIRVDGALKPLGDTPLSPGDVEALAVEHFGAARIERLARDGNVQRRARFELEGGSSLYGRSTLAKSAGAYGISIRFDVSNPMITFEMIAAPDVLKELLVAPGGLIVVAGGHGSGKTSTLHGLLDWINANRAVHIATVEDPLVGELEPKQALVQQREVGTDVPDAAAGIAAAIEQDVDVIMMAGLTTLESLSAALHAAETGHLVLTQVHAHTAEEALERIVEATPETMHALVRRILSQTLLGVTCQRLLPRDPKGRVANYQVLLPDDGLREAVAAGSPLTGFGAPGSIGFDAHLATLATAGTVSAATAADARAARA